MTAPRLAYLVILIVLAATVGACSNAAPSQPAATFPPGSVVIAAMNQKFNVTELHAPAGKAFQVVLDNQDSAPHNVAIYTDATYAKNVFPGQPIDPVHTVQVYDVGALAAGTYAFRCDIHPTTMSGSLIVGP